MLRLFTGYDQREAAGWHAFIQSVVETSTNYRIMPPLSGDQADGTNAFTYARFNVPDLCNFAGHAIFVDACDMLLLADIQELWELRDKHKAVQVVKHDYRTRHARKYVGTEMEADNKDYDRKNWSSVMLWNCGHMSNFNARHKIRKAIEKGDGKFLHRFGWLKDSEIGDLPMAWNWLPQEDGENKDAKLIHYTVGMPGFKHYAQDPMSNHWHETARTIHSDR
jgi:lipopolysaccharide biosynthesis glycosyltransferase